MANKIQIFSSIGYIFKLVVFLISIFEPDFFDHDYFIDTIRIITILPSIYPPKNKRKK